MKPGDVREKSSAELKQMSKDLQEELFRLRFRLGAGQLKETSNIRKVRRDLARVNTTIRERKIMVEREGVKS